MNVRRRKPASHWVMLAMALAVLVPSLLGFGTKFLEFIALYRGDVEGAFAISPIMNYLLASFGFLLLFGWAALGGMFRDIEAPKYAMLENELLLDEDSPQHGRNPLAVPATATDLRGVSSGNSSRQRRF